MGLVAQLARFVAIGAFCALVDFGIYGGLLALTGQHVGGGVDAGAWHHVAKGISFICGTTTAYLLNKRFTFRAAGGSGRFAGFVALYATTFALNVGMNALMLAVLPQMPFRLTAAWIVAQGTATLVNFVMLRTVVFREPRA
ncbi:GtrA family protein [Pseudonocardia thermophila]|jgi:Predicted membrane protein|nr:GtrA family protein [Pseudonocardia thermophila]